MASNKTGIERGQMRQFEQSSQQDKADARQGKDARSWKQNAGQNDGNQVERKIVALQVARHVNNGCDDKNVREQLKMGLQRIIQADLVVDQKEEIEDVPEDNEGTQVFDGVRTAGAG